MRSRAISIYAENVDDYNSQFDETRGHKEYIEEDEYDITSEEDDYSTLAGQSAQSNLDMFYGNNNSFSNDYEEEKDDEVAMDDDVFMTQGMTHEEQMGLLCEYLNKTLRNSSKEFSKLQFKKRSNLPSVSSHNAIYSIDTNHIISSLLSACNLPLTTTSGSSVGNEELFKEERIILMLISNISTKKNQMLKTFLNSDCIKIEQRPFDINTMHISILNRNIMLEIFNTEDTFHRDMNKMAAVYYSLAHCFIFIIDSSIENSSRFIEERYGNIMSHSSNKTLVLFDINDSKEKKCERNRRMVKSLSEQFGMIYLSMNVSECSLSNEIIVNLLTLIFIRKINHLNMPSSNEETMYTTPKKQSDKKLKMISQAEMIQRQSTVNSYSTNESDGSASGLWKKQGHNSLGYCRKYRLDHLSAFDFEENEQSVLKKKANEI